jgi:hypothetical protein
MRTPSLWLVRGAHHDRRNRWERRPGKGPGEANGDRRPANLAHRGLGLAVNRGDNETKDDM